MPPMTSVSGATWESFSISSRVVIDSSLLIGFLGHSHNRVEWPGFNFHLSSDRGNVAGYAPLNFALKLSTIGVSIIVNSSSLSAE